MQMQKNIDLFLQYIYQQCIIFIMQKLCITTEPNYFEPTQKKQNVYYLGIFDQGLF